MTSNLDVVKAWHAGSLGDVDANMAYTAEGFQSVDKDGNVEMDRAAWEDMSHLLLASFKDLDYPISDLREEGDAVIQTGHFEGTFTADLDLSAMGLGVIPATGKKIVWPEESVAVTVEGGKISRIKAYGDSGGMEAFLAPLGIRPPQE